MKIGGFNVGKKTIIAVGVVIGVIIIGSAISSNNKKKELEARQAEIEQRQQEQEAQVGIGENFDEDEMERQKFIEKWGEPPEGFMWNDEGELYALSDDGKTAEEVVYTFVRAVSMQDFSTAQKYTKKSQIVKSYNRFYEDSASADYYNLFLRKQFKFAMTSIELVETTDTAVFADGTTVISMKLKVLDLTDKDFWKVDEGTIYNTLRTYKRTEDDDIKANQYLYDYIYAKYEDGTIAKKDVVVDFKLTKQYGGGWLLQDDSELNHHLLYEEGFDIVPYIRQCYNEWFQVQLEREAEEKERTRKER